MGDEEAFRPFADNEGGMPDEHPSELDVGQGLFPPVSRLLSIMRSCSPPEMSAMLPSKPGVAPQEHSHLGSHVRAQEDGLFHQEAALSLLLNRFLLSALKTSVCFPTRISSLWLSTSLVTFAY